MMPRFRAARLAEHVPLADICREIDAVFGIYDKIDDVTISGGEPLLHPQLYEISEYFLQYAEQFENCRIFTNGTIVPSGEVIELLKNGNGGGKLKLVIDNYGEGLSRKANEIVRLADGYNVDVRVNKYFGEQQHSGGWIDNGAVDELRGYSEEEARILFGSCHCAQYKCLAVFGGKLGNCCWSTVGRSLGYFGGGETSEDIDLFDAAPLAAKKAAAAAFGKAPLNACKYCNGFIVENSPRFPAAEQV
jgi:hypothetical protein